MVTIFSKSYISYGVKVLRVLSSGAVCIFSKTDQSWARPYRVCRKSVKSAAIENTQGEPFCAGEMRIQYFCGHFFFGVLRKKRSSRRVVKIMCPWATPLGTHFPEGAPCIYIYMCVL